MIELIQFEKSPAKGKKYMVVLEQDKVKKTVHFGADGYSDYTMHNDKKRRENYRSRHKNDHINDPYKAGSWSWHVLWGNSTDLNENLKRFLKAMKIKDTRK